MRVQYFCLILFCVFVNNVFGDDSDSLQPDLNFRMHFNALSKKRYPLFEAGEPWLQGREYVKERMRHYGARDLREQKFNTTVEGKEIQGVNLIGVAEGLKTDSNKSVIVVGADYDTNIVSNQLKDNTGGVSVLLETMHLFFDKVYWNQYYQNYTVIFVAFDVNTREYRDNGMGNPGSYFFINDWLFPYLENKTHPKEFQGAIILDSITTFNSGNNTQKLRDGFKEAMPQAYEEITSRGMEGDFLGFLYTSNDQHNPIRRTFTREYNKDRKMRPFRLQEMPIHLAHDLIGDDVLGMINHQSHYYFWTNLKERYLPGFLLFDTDEDREDPTGDTCGAISCSVDDFLTKERIDFLTKTTYTLAETLLKLQTVHVDFPNGAAVPSSSAVVFLSIFCLLMTLILKRL